MTMFRILIITCVLFLSACGNSNSVKQKKIIVIGDSISTGYNIAESWPSRLQKSLNVRLNNHSVNGEQTEYGLENIEALLKQQKPTHVIILLGTNDVYKGSANTAIKNLNAMVSISKKYDTQTIVLTIPPSLGPETAQQSTRAINQAITAMASDVIVIDVFAAFEYALKNSQQPLLHDKVHPNEAGQELIFKTVLNTLQAPST